jgi:hypothetical protein
MGKRDVIDTHIFLPGLLTLIEMAYSAPDVEWPKIWSVLAVPSLQLIQKF